VASWRSACFLKAVRGEKIFDVVAWLSGALAAFMALARGVMAAYGGWLAWRHLFPARRQRFSGLPGGVALAGGWFCGAFEISSLFCCGGWRLAVGVVAADGVGSVCDMAWRYGRATRRPSSDFWACSRQAVLLARGVGRSVMACGCEKPYRRRIKHIPHGLLAARAGVAGRN